MLQVYLIRTTDDVLIRVCTSFGRVVQRAIGGRTALWPSSCVAETKVRMAAASPGKERNFFSGGVACGFAVIRRQCPVGIAAT